MGKKCFESYLNIIYNNQSIGNYLYNGLFSMQDYKSMYDEVSLLIEKYGDLPIDSLRDMLFYHSGVYENLSFFIKDRAATPGAVISYGTPFFNETITIGNAREVGFSSNGNIELAIRKMQNDTIFDLASVSKIFITLSIVKLVQQGNIGINDEITKYCPEFTNLKGITIFDLITFRVPLITDSRIEKASDKGEALDLLHNIKINQNKVKSVYSDMGVMILKYVVESVSGMSYYNFVNEFILKKANMHETSYKPLDVSRVASTNFRTQIIDDCTSIVDMYADGEVNDPKAQIMQSTSGDLCGHAGMFSTAGDMTNLALSLINGTLLSPEEIDEITKNRTGSLYFERDIKKSHQYFGYLCYLKNPILQDSEVYHCLSGKSFAYAGFTGTQFTVDPINGLYLFLGSNRVHDRVTYVNPSANPVKYQTISKRSMIEAPNEGLKIDARNFAYEKDKSIIHPILRLCMKYKMLDDLLLDQNRELEAVKRVRKI